MKTGQRTPAKGRLETLFKKMLALLIPLILINSLNVSTYIINSIWVGNLLGEIAVAAITNCYSIWIMLSAITVGLAGAVSVLIAQCYGACDEDGIKEIINFGYLISAIVGVVVFVMVVTLSPFFMYVFGTPESAYADVRVYLSLYSFAFIFNVVLSVMSESVRALGNTKTPLLFVAIETIVNVIFVPVFILRGFGIAGVGYANVLAKIITCIIAVMVVYRKYPVLKLTRQHFKFRFAVLKKVVSVGVPIAADQLIIAVVISFEIGMSNRAGVLGAATYGVVSKWEEVFFIISQSLQALMVIMIGQNIVKRDKEMIYRIVKCGVALATLPMVIIAIVSYGAPGFFCKFFINSDDVIDSSIQYLSIAGIAHILAPLRLIFNGFIIGTARTGYLMLASMLASIGEIVAIYLLQNSTELECMTILSVAVVVYVLVAMFFCLLFFAKGTWRRDFVVQRVEEAP